MEVTLPADLSMQVEQDVFSGRYETAGELIEEAVRVFLDDRHSGQRGLEALRRIGHAVDQAGLYEPVLLPDAE